MNLDRIPAETFVRQIVHQQAVASTSNLALELCRQHELSTPLLVIADQQTAGRGRGKNQWWSGPGALTFTLILDPVAIGLATALWPRIALTAAVSVGEVMSHLAPDCVWSVKWPNDVLLSGRKVCGILLEPAPRTLPTPSTAVDSPGMRAPGSVQTGSEHPLPARLVLGIGVNLNNSFDGAPDDVQRRATSVFHSTGRQESPVRVLSGLLRHLEQNLELLATGNPALSARWMDRCALRGADVAVNVGTDIVRGLCQGIDTDGALVVDTPSGRQRLYGGTIETGGPMAAWNS